MGYRKTHKIEVVHLTSSPYYSFKAVDNGPYKRGQPSNYLPSQKKEKLKQDWKKHHYDQCRAVKSEITQEEHSTAVNETLSSNTFQMYFFLLFLKNTCGIIALPWFYSLFLETDHDNRQTCNKESVEFVLAFGLCHYCSDYMY